MTYDPIEHFREKARKGLCRKLETTPSARKPRKRRPAKASVAPELPPPVVHYPARRAVVRVWTLCRARRKGPPHVTSRDPLGVTCPACLASMRAAELQLLIPGC